MKFKFKKEQTNFSNFNYEINPFLSYEDELYLGIKKMLKNINKLDNFNFYVNEILGIDSCNFETKKNYYHISKNQDVYEIMDKFFLYTKYEIVVRNKSNNKKIKKNLIDIHNILFNNYNKIDWFNLSKNKKFKNLDYLYIPPCNFN